MTYPDIRDAQAINRADDFQDDGGDKNGIKCSESMFRLKAESFVQCVRANLLDDALHEDFSGVLWRYACKFAWLKCHYVPKAFAQP